MFSCGIANLYALILSIGVISNGYLNSAYFKISRVEIRDGWKGEVENYNYVYAPFAATFLGIVFHYILALFKLDVRIGTFIFSLIGAVFWGLLLTTSDEHSMWKIICSSIIFLSEELLLIWIIIYIKYIAPKGHFQTFSYTLSLGFTFGMILAYLCQTWLNLGKIAIIGCILCTLEALFIWIVKKTPDNDYLLLPIDIRQHEWKQINKKFKVLYLLTTLSILIVFSCFTIIPHSVKDLIDMTVLNISANTIATISQVLVFLGALVSFFIIEQFSKKLIWCISAAGCALFQLLYVFASGFKWGKKTPTAALLCSYFFYGLGLWPLFWSSLFKFKFSFPLVSIITVFISSFSINYIPIENLIRYNKMIISIIFSIITLIYGLFLLNFEVDEDENNTDSDTEKGTSLSHTEEDNSNHDIENDNIIHDAEADNNIHDTEKDNNISYTEGNNKLSNEENNDAIKI